MEDRLTVVNLQLPWLKAHPGHNQPLQQVQNSQSPHHKAALNSHESEKPLKHDDSIPVSGEQHVLMKSMARLLQAQMYMLAAQMQAVTALDFPPLKQSKHNESFEVA